MQKGQNEHQLIHRVNAAKSNVEEADQLIRDYMPFIRTETGKFLKRPPVEGRDGRDGDSDDGFLRGYRRIFKRTRSISELCGDADQESPHRQRQKRTEAYI